MRARDCNYYGTVNNNSGLARIEKIAVLKLGIADLLGGRMQGAPVAESGDLGALAIVVCRHVGPWGAQEQESYP